MQTTTTTGAPPADEKAVGGQAGGGQKEHASTVPQTAPESSPFDYLSAGYSLFPCKAGGKQPATAHGFLDATADPDQIADWLAECPNTNWGLPTAGRHRASPDAHEQRLRRRRPGA